MHRSIFRSIVAGACAAALLAAPAALAAKPAAPSGGYTGTTSQGRPFHLDVKNGRITFIYVDVLLSCPGSPTTGSILSGSAGLLGRQARLTHTSSGRYRFSLDQPSGVAMDAQGSFSRNGKRLRGTATLINPDQVPVDGGPSITCGSTKAADGTITNPPITFTAKR